MLLQASSAAAFSRSIDPAWAWSPFEPTAKQPWDLRAAGHLYRRAAFGANWQELQQALRDGPQASVDRLVRPKEDPAAFNRTYDGHEAAAIDPGGGAVETLGQWWLRRMLLTPQPLLEKMTLFWHHYFGVTNVRVASGLLMQEHIQLLRRHALGRFQPLLEEIVRDRATLLSLEAQANRKALPSENLARAVLEEYTVGTDQCSKEDVREAARAVTGWFVLRNNLRFLDREHDPGEKRILGQTGPWKSEDLARITASHPATSRRLVRRLYTWFVSECEPPTDALLAPLAESFHKDGDVGRLVERILRSNLIFSPVAYRRRVKGPIEYALGIVRGLEVLVPTAPLERDVAALGQKLGQPPTVRGWPGGTAWLGNFAMTARVNVAASILAGIAPYGEQVNPAALAAKHGFSSSDAAARFFVDLFLQGDLDEGVAASLRKAAGTSSGEAWKQEARQLAHLVVTLPEFQLG
jgi:uncharacterized protein (DUF1800 family)